MPAADIAAADGAAHHHGRWSRRICLIHGSRSGHSNRLALRDGDRGLIIYCHVSSNVADILAELRWRGLLGSRSDRRNATLRVTDRRSRYTGRDGQERTSRSAAAEAIVAPRSVRPSGRRRSANRNSVGLSENSVADVGGVTPW
jgi:hypothetical protein